MNKKSEEMHLARAEVERSIRNVVGSEEGNHLIIEKSPDKILMVFIYFYSFVQRSYSTESTTPCMWTRFFCYPAIDICFVDK